MEIDELVASWRRVVRRGDAAVLLALDEVRGLPVQDVPIPAEDGGSPARPPTSFQLGLRGLALRPDLVMVTRARRVGAPGRDLSEDTCIDLLAWCRASGEGRPLVALATFGLHRSADGRPDWEPLHVDERVLLVTPDRDGRLTATRTTTSLRSRCHARGALRIDVEALRARVWVEVLYAALEEATPREEDPHRAVTALLEEAARSEDACPER